jgi:O-antigen/teichoic acid export membrane protein
VSRGAYEARVDLEKLRQMLAFSLPLVPASVGVFLNGYADRLIIQHIRSLADVGLYGVGYRLAMVASLLLVGFQGATMPLILARQNEPSMPADIARIFRLFSALGLSAFVLLSVMAPPALHVLAAPEYERASTVVPFLVLAWLFAGMYMFAPGIVIAKDTMIAAKLTVAAGLANVVIVLVLVPLFGIEGAGVGTAATSLGWFAALMHASQRRYSVPHDWRALTAALVAASAVVAVAMLMLPTTDVTLTAGELAIRAGLVLVGAAAATWLAVGRNDIRAALTAVSSLRQPGHARGRR